MAVETNPARIIIADDHPIVRWGIKTLLHEHGEKCLVVGEAGSSRELTDVLENCPCDLLVTDYSMPDESGSEDGLVWLGNMRRAYPALPVIVLTMIRNPTLIRGMLKTGVKGIVGKLAMTRELLLAIGAVRAGRTYLSEHMRTAIADTTRTPDIATTSKLSAREAEVLRLYASGLTVSQIAERMHRSVKTVSQQKNDAMRKLSLTNNSQIFQYAHQQGLTV